MTSFFPGAILFHDIIAENERLKKEASAEKMDDCSFVLRIQHKSEPYQSVGDEVTLRDAAGLCGTVVFFRTKRST